MTPTDNRPSDSSRNLRAIVSTSKRAGKRLAGLSGPERTRLLTSLADRLDGSDARSTILAANALDMERAGELQSRGELPPALVARVALDDDKISGLVAGLRQLAEAPESVGRIEVRRMLDDGLELERQRWPLGLLGIVFEARPDAVVQITGLALKSGNAVALKGGREARESNRVLVDIITEQLVAQGLQPQTVTLLEGRAEFRELLELDDLVDLVIARGSGEFVRMIQSTSKIPVMGHAEGRCHIYMHADADPDMAARINVDAKCSYPAACNAMETLLWHRDAGDALSASARALLDAGVRLHACPSTLAHLSTDSDALVPATSEDFDREWSGLECSVRRVDDLEAALAHIDAHGSGHTESILTADSDIAERFLAGVDAACVFHNASTRFSDGYRFGLGAEVGISTGKLHDRGPVGVEGLLTHRWRLRGQGQVTRDYGPGKRAFRHIELETNP